MELMLVSGPTGQPYYYNAQTHESTYVRPLPPPFAMASQMGIIPGTTTCGLSDGAAWPVKNAITKSRPELEDYIRSRKASITSAQKMMAAH